MGSQEAYKLARDTAEAEVRCMLICSVTQYNGAQARSDKVSWQNIIVSLETQLDEAKQVHPPHDVTRIRH